MQGQTTTVDSRNLVVEDNIITLNENASSATDAGIMINRTAENNAIFIWDETDDKFKVGTTTGDGSTMTDLAITRAKLEVAAPTSDFDASTKKYVDDSIGALSSVSNGTQITLGSPTDSTFGDGSFDSLTSATKDTAAIDS